VAIVEYVAGNTIRLRMVFSDFSGAVPSSEPTNIVLKLYDANMKQYGASVSLDSGDKVDICTYDAFVQVPEDYTRLSNESIMYYKIYAILDGQEIVDGGKFKRVFIKN